MTKLERTIMTVKMLQETNTILKEENAALRDALKTISSMSEKSLLLYANGKTVEWKTLTGFVTEKAKEALQYK